MVANAEVTAQSDLQIEIVAAADLAEPMTNEASSSAPAVIEAIDQMMAPLENVIGLLYVIGDCILVVMAAAMPMSKARFGKYLDFLSDLLCFGGGG
ncbi:hypothetical protein IQ241_12600 [Romeria aff. gracilis LEGE 07310]|uniref:Uncharacterized protein n=1 Tax=Vasconcelosia minhoensis LEGE 07310 TaxID=915328 RepID=A0A8J7AN78_9CYAN|nr:hypothetical protein [Romeria gracilis]MBE9078120.1 hypothetical protein [Romeria aff. gracilis LEGE 07310]